MMATYDGLARFDGVRFVPFCGRDGGFWAPRKASAQWPWAALS
jgi:hypothetical protein